MDLLGYVRCQSCVADSTSLGPTLSLCRAMMTLEYDFATSLDFGGIQTSDAESGLNRAAKGGMLGAGQLRAIVTLTKGQRKSHPAQAWDK